MGARLGVVRAEAQSALSMAARSQSALDRPLRLPAELWVAFATDEATLFGAFQRAAGMAAVGSALRRGSGGPAVFVGEGTVHVQLSLEHPGVLVGGDERRIVNRAVRPLLRGLGRVLGASGPASYFGRDWVSVGRAPGAWVGFAHDATTRRTSFEAFVSVRTPFAPSLRPSFRGKEPRSLEAVLGRTVDAGEVAEAIVRAYASDAEEAVDLAVEPEAAAGLSLMADPRADPPWLSEAEEAIGTVGAGPDANGVFRVGGDLLVSRDAIARLEIAAATTPEADLGAVIDGVLGAPGVALDGVRSLTTIRDVIAAARFQRA